MIGAIFKKASMGAAYAGDPFFGRSSRTEDLRDRTAKKLSVSYEQILGICIIVVDNIRIDRMLVGSCSFWLRSVHVTLLNAPSLVSGKITHVLGCTRSVLL